MNNEEMMTRAFDEAWVEMRRLSEDPDYEKRLEAELTSIYSAGAVALEILENGQRVVFERARDERYIG